MRNETTLDSTLRELETMDLQSKDSVTLAAASRRVREIEARITEAERVGTGPMQEHSWLEFEVSRELYLN